MAELHTIATLLSEQAWLKRVARRLVERGAADDLVQDAYQTALRARPDRERPVRPWLVQVLRNKARSRARGERRRVVRELASSDAANESTTPHDLAATLEIRTLLCETLRALDEPFRRTLFAHYYEDKSLAEIARDEAVPEGTVRWRHHEGLARVRAALDHEPGRTAWLAGLVPLCTASPLPRVADLGKVVVVKKLIAIALVLVVMLATLLFVGFKAEVAAPNNPPRTAAANGTERARAPARDITAARERSALVRNRRISGRVLFGDAPVATARVTVNAPLGVLASATDSAGGFSFEVPSGVYSLAVVAPDRMMAGATIDVRDRARTDLVIRMQRCNHELTGTVSDDSGGAIAGAVISRGWATTDRDGHYRICDNDELNTVTVEATGYASEGYQLEWGETVLDFALRPEALLTGHVVGTDQAAIADAEVEVVADRRHDHDAATMMYSLGAVGHGDANGRFEIHGLGAGAYAMVARASGHVVPDPIEVVLNMGANSDRTVVMASAAVVRGIARTAGAPLADTVIQWIPDHPARENDPEGFGLSEGILGLGLLLPHGEARTDGEGRFAIDSVPSGRGSFLVTGYEPVAGAIVGTQPIAVDLVPRAQIRGVVVRKGVPVAGARVIGNDFATTDSDGTFALSVLPGVIGVRALSSELGAQAPEIRVTVARGQIVDGVRLELACAASIAGTVVDQRGEPIAGAKLTTHNPANDGHGLAVAGRDGTFVIRRLAGGKGTYGISVAFGGAALAPVGPPPAIAIPDDDAAIAGVRIAVTLRRATIAGIVVDRAGTPIADVTIQPRSRHPAGSAAQPARSGVDGRFAVELIDNGPYDLSVSGAPGARVIVVPAVSPGVHNVRIVLGEPGSVL